MASLWLVQASWAHYCLRPRQKDPRLVAQRSRVLIYADPKLAHVLGQGEHPARPLPRTPNIAAPLVERLIGFVADEEEGAPWMLEDFNHRLAIATLHPKAYSK